MTKSAIKKANKLARIERKQQQKLKAKEKAQAQTVSTEPASVPQSKSQDVVKAEEVEVEQPPVAPPPAPVPAPLPLADPVKEEVKTNGAAAVVASKDLPPPPPQQPPAVEKAIPKPPSPPRVPEVKVEVRRPTPPKSNGTNGTTTVDAENVKKRQNVLERTVWTFIMIGGFIGELYAIPSSSSTNSPSSRSLTSWSWVHGPARNVVSNTGIQGDYHSILSQEGGTRIS